MRLKILQLKDEKCFARAVGRSKKGEKRFSKKG
jgi:hypothetical protein